MLQKNIGISFMPMKSCQYDINKKYFCGLPIEDLDMKRELHFVYRKDFMHHKVIDDLTQIYNQISYE
jgi:hypothetical protein